jgi:3-methyladenine DNA glycosylase AlkD
MTLDEAMSKLESLGNPKIREYNSRNGAGDKQFGVKLGDLRGVAKTIKKDPTLARELWQTGNLDAMLLATLIMQPKDLSADEVEALVRTVPYPQLADWLNSYVVKAHPEKEALRQEWMHSSDAMSARAGWSLTTERVQKEPDGLDIGKLLDRIEAEMPDAPEVTQWTMNFCLAAIGINFAEHRERAISIGEKLGLYRDYPTSKGCTSPFAPIWINEMVRRQQ